jgi:hypothetical protein
MAPHTGAGTNPRGMECLIPVINKLQDVFDQTGITSSSIELPQIAVVGSQVMANLMQFWCMAINVKPIINILSI